jgi:hypothetical protein
MFIVVVDHDRVPVLSQHQIDVGCNMGQEQPAKIAKELIANAIRMHGKVTLTIRQ